jgi:hypothetical protein
MRKKIVSSDLEKGERLKMNKLTLWYHQKKICERKPLKIYNKTRVSGE